jgi:hypothetical protein
MSPFGPSATSFDVGCLVAIGVKRTLVRRVTIDFHDPTPTSGAGFAQAAPPVCFALLGKLRQRLSRSLPLSRN